jgi:hypothetical protein
MKKVKAALGLLALGLIFVLSITSAQAIDLSGTWIGKTEVPDMGADEVTLVLKKVENGYSGTISDSLNVVAADTEIKDATIENDVLSFTFPLADGAIITMKLTVSENKLSGQWEHPEGSTGAIEFVLKK